MKTFAALFLIACLACSAHAVTFSGGWMRVLEGGSLFSSPETSFVPPQQDLFGDVMATVCDGQLEYSTWLVNVEPSLYDSGSGSTTDPVPVLVVCVGGRPTVFEQKSMEPYVRATSASYPDRYPWSTLAFHLGDCPTAFEFTVLDSDYAASYDWADNCQLGLGSPTLTPRIASILLRDFCRDIYSLDLTELRVPAENLRFLIADVCDGNDSDEFSAVGGEMESTQWADYLCEARMGPSYRAATAAELFLQEPGIASQNGYDGFTNDYRKSSNMGPGSMYYMPRSIWADTDFVYTRDHAFPFSTETSPMHRAYDDPYNPNGIGYSPEYHSNFDAERGLPFDTDYGSGSGLSGSGASVSSIEVRNDVLRYPIKPSRWLGIGREQTYVNQNVYDESWTGIQERLLENSMFFARDGTGEELYSSWFSDDNFSPLEKGPESDWPNTKGYSTQSYISLQRFAAYLDQATVSSLDRNSEYYKFLSYSFVEMEFYYRVSFYDAEIRRAGRHRDIACTHKQAPLQFVTPSLPNVGPLDLEVPLGTHPSNFMFPAYMTLAEKNQRCAEALTPQYRAATSHEVRGYLKQGAAVDAADSMAVSEIFEGWTYYYDSSENEFFGNPLPAVRDTTPAYGRCRLPGLVVADSLATVLPAGISAISEGYDTEDTVPGYKAYQAGSVRLVSGAEAESYCLGGYTSAYKGSEFSYENSEDHYLFGRGKAQATPYRSTYGYLACIRRETAVPASSDPQVVMDELLANFDVEPDARMKYCKMHAQEKRTNGGFGNVQNPFPVPHIFDTPDDQINMGGSGQFGSGPTCGLAACYNLDMGFHAVECEGACATVASASPDGYNVWDLSDLPPAMLSPTLADPRITQPAALAYVQPGYPGGPQHPIMNRPTPATGNFPVGPSENITIHHPNFYRLPASPKLSMAFVWLAIPGLVDGAVLPALETEIDSGAWDIVVWISSQHHHGSDNQCVDYPWRTFTIRPHFYQHLDNSVDYNANRFDKDVYDVLGRSFVEGSGFGNSGPDYLRYVSGEDVYEEAGGNPTPFDYTVITSFDRCVYDSVDSDCLIPDFVNGGYTSFDPHDLDSLHQLFLLPQMSNRFLAMGFANPASARTVLENDEFALGIKWFDVDDNNFDFVDD